MIGTVVCFTEMNIHIIVMLVIDHVFTLSLTLFSPNYSYIRNERLG
jgi:hypothetical protein